MHATCRPEIKPKINKMQTDKKSVTAPKEVEGLKQRCEFEAYLESVPFRLHFLGSKEVCPWENSWWMLKKTT